MLRLWALLDSNQRASDYESEAGSFQHNDLARSGSAEWLPAVAHCRAVSRPVVTDLVTAASARPLVRPHADVRGWA